MACPCIFNAENFYYSCRKPVTLYRIGFQNKTSNATMLAHQTYVQYFWSQHLEVHDPRFETNILHFPYCHSSEQDTNFCQLLYKDSPIYIAWNTYNTVNNLTYYTRKHCGILDNLYSHTQFETQMGQGQPIAIHDFVHFIIFASIFSNSQHNHSSISFYIILHINCMKCHSVTTKPLIYFHVYLQPMQNTNMTLVKVKAQLGSTYTSTGQSTFISCT
jgi:hypothetical protein